MLDECEKKKDLLNKLKSSEDKLQVIRQQLKKKTEQVIFTKRKMEMLQYDLGTLIRNEQISNWPEKVARIYDKHFDTDTTKDTYKTAEKEENL